MCLMEQNLPSDHALTKAPSCKQYSLGVVCVCFLLIVKSYACSVSTNCKRGRIHGQTFVL